MEDYGEIIQGIIKGDRGSLSRIFHNFYPGLCRFAMKYTGSPEVSEDLVQDVYLQIWQNRSELSDEGCFKSFLYKMVRNRALNYLRHERIKSTKALELLDFHNEPNNSPSDEFIEKENIEELEKAIEKAIDRLPDRQKIIFSLSKDDGLTYQEIAEVLDISVKTVETQISRSKKTLRDTLLRYITLITLFV